MIIQESREVFDMCNRVYLNRFCYPERSRTSRSVLYLSAVSRCFWYLGCVVMMITCLKETRSHQQLTLKTEIYSSALGVIFLKLSADLKVGR